MIERLYLEFEEEARCPTEWVECLGSGREKAVSAPLSPLIQFVSEIRNAVKYLCSCWVQLRNGQRLLAPPPPPNPPSFPH